MNGQSRVTEVNLFYPLSKGWGAAESGWGQEKHATYNVLFESAMRNTGDSSGDVKCSGK